MNREKILTGAAMKGINQLCLYPCENTVAFTDLRSNVNYVKNRESPANSKRACHGIVLGKRHSRSVSFCKATKGISRPKLAA